MCLVGDFTNKKLISYICCSFVVEILEDYKYVGEGVVIYILYVCPSRLASLASDLANRQAAEMLSKRYQALEQEMAEIGKMWEDAKRDLTKYAQQRVSDSELYACTFSRTHFSLATLTLV